MLQVDLYPCHDCSIDPIETFNTIESIAYCESNISIDTFITFCHTKSIKTIGVIKMKITIFSAKGGVGKTPIAYNIAKDHGYAMGTNETFHVLDQVMEEESLIAIPPNDEFPDFGEEVDIVFDLGGAVGADSAPSIVSAVRQSDLVLVPVDNEYKSINGAFHSITEILPHNDRIALVVTKLEKRKGEIFADWKRSADFKEVTNTLSELLERTLPAFPLKSSKVFRHIFDRELSIAEICEKGGVDRYHFEPVNRQFKTIYQFIEGGEYRA